MGTQVACPMPCGTVVTSCSAGNLTPSSVAHPQPHFIPPSSHFVLALAPTIPRSYRNPPPCLANCVDALCAKFKLALTNITTCDSSSYVIVMSDGIAPAIDKVGEPAPTAPEAEAGAPTLSTAAPTSEEPKPEEKKGDENKVEDGAKPALKVPKPVEIMSVPQTPLNNSTPAGGTPRPELKIDEEPKDQPKEEEAPFILGLQEPNSTPADSVSKNSEANADKPAEAATNGDNKDVEMTGVLPSSTSSESASGEKRKLEDPVIATTNGDDTSSEDKSGSEERADKKARVEDDDAPALAATNGKATKAKRAKKAAPVAGKTARKTRSQGPVEV
ncbi:hypothetical protein B0J13DRAFT_105815 [Dactylonectria estremocensis]|uniref:Uncharacterized protein n=1 Tax=Dactylonectria estremocensis TaxID=1079267 RepID=A0A9P9IQL5_9HYPO|nr:hypothetical protein B0J13DRAFT_105815 [Dactylonectria estremocensis]